ncbi:tetratricopeptide repeat-containing sulfotransferase family protein [Sneathiella glossodoripedis]|uniref:tetratricopeptide repeat-containing sulfotransferase family protein n=1 Tax=Sneathiella glossodoripedis TaxID=418853 RepID=UPI0004724E9C|nr:sulfotransferase [Sneathiella glossodoripedis]
MQQSAINQALTQAVQLHTSGQLDKAETIYRQILAQAPKNSDCYNLLGTLYHQRGKQRIAVELIEKAIKIGPKKAMYYNNLGNAYREAGENRLAEKAFRKALKIDPKYASALNNLGGSLLASGNLASAASTFQKVLKLDPKFYPARHNLGNVYYEGGDTEKAIICYRQVLKEAPDYTKAARNLSEAKKFTEKDDDYVLLQKMAEKTDYTGENKANVLFAFAKAQEDLKEYETAFETYIQANKAHRETFKYDISETAAELQEIRETISEEYFSNHLNDGQPNNRPIFIFGMPRSGTSLVEQILSSHSKVFGAGELYSLEKTYFHMIRKKGDRTFRQAFIEEGPTFLKDLGKSYLRDLPASGSKAAFITDKMPRNFIYAGLIKLILPQAKLIHCKRSPEDTCLSIFKRYFVGQQKFAYDLAELGQYYNLYLEHMAYWRDLLGESLFEIQYENLIANQETETRKLLEYSGLEWEDACLEFHKTRRVVRTASTDQVRQPIYTSSIEGWRRYETQLAPLLKELNTGL